MAQHISQHTALAQRRQRRRTRAVAALTATILVLGTAAGGTLLWEHTHGMRPGALAGAAAGHIETMLRPAGETMPQNEASERYPSVVSPVDFDGDGVDDYTDILDGARKDAQTMPAYDGGYYEGWYPPDDRGACTDVVWRAMRDAGYDLKAMVDSDIAAHPDAYAQVVSSPDPNIDFRRTGVLDVFLSRYAVSLSTSVDPADLGDWNGGDIVVFEHTRHIGVVSDRRDEDGLPYIIHNMGQKHRENDYLAFHTHMTVTGRYRFDASRIPADVLRAWGQ
ncbi:DUF1287 domain-containing protein [Bifidobacterium samirii]|uniref:DUF1287 domain-containing protein n=1 Tax=Bifidobacterium samirii TaxID=2306974 RepID=A0A430FTQ4_9BIFI|nr:DUF1287 domain-containing protein [Bifidobacterium samirii]RSX56261.1 hypothetical protein D2E24_1250 [Bifidobacterium samirii]